MKKSYKKKQKQYKKAIKVLKEVLETKLHQVSGEPKEKIWKDQELQLRGSIEMVEEEIPYLDPNH